MWLYTPDYFVSIVDNHEHYPSMPGAMLHLTARFRKQRHAECFRAEAAALYDPALHGPDPLSEIVETPRRDYQYRIVIDRELCALVVHEAAKRITYPNFKDTIESYDEKGAYHLVWSATLALADDNAEEAWETEHPMYPTSPR